MREKKKDESPRMLISAGTCLVIGVILSLVFKNIRIGLVVGLVLGLLGGGLLSSRR